ncbi:MAG: type II toxin-antitoxin system VapC family toxin [Stenotrophobium sp.]
MRVLLDTHAFVWALVDPDKLAARARKVLEDKDTEVVVSTASAWEIATKYRIGKLPGAARIVGNYSAAIHGLKASELSITSAHALKAGSYTQPHRDPFDRMLVAQAEIEKLTIIGCDPALKQFGTKLLW